MNHDVQRVVSDLRWVQRQPHQRFQIQDVQIVQLTSLGVLPAEHYQDRTRPCHGLATSRRLQQKQTDVRDLSIPMVMGKSNLIEQEIHQLTSGDPLLGL